MRNLEAKRVIIKIGSSSLVKSDMSFNKPILVSLMNSIAQLQQKGIDVALVSSGAIAYGMHELGFTKKPKDMPLKQACAAVGQAKLMELYNNAASIYGLKTGQILVNHDDFEIRKRMNHLKDTLDAMFKNKIIPIINENDALAVEEIKVGDNDTLASLFTPMINADLLILFSDIDGLFTKNPKVYDDAKLINVVDKIDETVLSMVGGVTSDVGTGGMSTKIDAALITTYSGSNMIICNSERITELVDIVMGVEIGTLFVKSDKAISNKDHWVIFKNNSKGSIIIDDGCKAKLSEKKVSILPKGITKVEGEFLKGSIVDVRDINGELIAKGLTNYSSYEINQIKGLSSTEANKLVVGKKEVIHANELVLLGGYYGRFTD